MGVAYLIGPIEETDLRINVEELTIKLLDKWKGSKIQYIQDSTSGYLLDWSIEMGTIDSPILGGIQKSGYTISLEGYLESCVEFGVWYRNLIPAKYVLYFFDSALDSYAELQIGSSVDKVIEEYEKDYGKKPWP
jgi:hypothetical protein